MLIIRCNLLLKPQDIKAVRKKILEQVESGVVVLPYYCEPIVVPDDMEIRFEGKEDTDDVKIIAVDKSESLIRCKDCQWFGTIGCSIRIVDDSDKPSEDDFCSFAERRTDDDRA